MLMCPVNKLGHVNLYIVGNHGMAGATSPALVDGIAPQVAIMDNGAHKGGGIPALDVIHSAPSKPVLWQLHYAEKKRRPQHRESRADRQYGGADRPRPVGSE